MWLRRLNIMRRKAKKIFVKRKQPLLIWLIVVALLAVTIVGTLLYLRSSTAPKLSDKKSNLIASENVDKSVAAIVAEMTLEEKIGQLVMIGFDGADVNSHVKNMIIEHKVGGIILFDRNGTSAAQVAELNNSLQLLAKTASEKDLLTKGVDYFEGRQRPEIGLFIAIDQEGGLVYRFDEFATIAPSALKIASKGKPEDAYDLSKMVGSELATMGINVNFAPVLDVEDRSKRGFSNSPETVFKYGLQSIKGYNDAELTACAKHFPGLGRVQVDTHKDTDVVKASLDELKSKDLVPYYDLKQSGYSQDKYWIMVTHAAFPAFGDDLPASISPKTIGYLRKILGFNGIVISDDMEMGALTKRCAYEDMGWQAIAAGCDIALVCHTEEVQLKVINGMLQAARDGRLKADRINESVTRVLKQKLEKNVFALADPAQAAKITGCQEHKDMVAKFK